MKYLNFDVNLYGYTDKGYLESCSVRVVASPAGQQKTSAAERVQLPLDIRTQQRLLDRRGHALDGMVRVGKALGDVLFPDTVRRMLETSLARLKDTQGLRIRLHIESQQLANLPWEYAYLARDEGAPNALEGFLALDKRISLVRFEDMLAPAASLEPVRGDLRFVALMASPATLEPLRLDRERRVLEEAFAPLPGVRQEFYERATPHKLLDAFATTAHVFHYAGHALYDARAGEGGSGYLFLESDDSRHVPFSAERLALVLQNKGVRMAMLAGCQTAQRDGINPWTGVAPALVRAGIPAVVGMQFKIYDTNAIAFSRQFYQTLLKGEDIDAAMHAGRLAILTRTLEDDRDWGAPVLYMRSDDGVLFPAAEPAHAERSASPGNSDLPPPRIPRGRSTAQSRARRATVSTPTTARAPNTAPASIAEIIMPPLPAETHQLKVLLRDTLSSRFNIAELETLCHTLSVDFEEIAGTTKLMRALNIVEHFSRRDRLPDLIAEVRRVRPGAF